MATLPRLRPRTFYDLVIEVALIRPGPIQGGSVHPYLRRRNGQEPVSYPHPMLEDCLKKTLGVPLFQEQLMQMAIDIAGFTPGESDQLRQAMGSKRSRTRMAAMRERLLAGMSERGITGAPAEEIATKFEAFADFGFPESHSVSFAYLVYSSSWIKLHYPAEFACALLNAQPMGFYSPHTIVRDAMRHGVEVLGPEVNASRKDCTLEPRTSEAGPVGHPRPDWHADPSTRAVRMGLRYVRGLADALLDRIDAERERAPFTDLEDFTRRSGAPTDAIEALATAGAFASLGQTRRSALWAAGALRDARPDKLPGLVTGIDAPSLPGMTEVEETAADLWATGLSPGRHPTEFVRRHDRGPPRAASPQCGRGGGHRDAPSAARHGQGRGLRQPRGRDRIAQRDLHRRRMAPVPQGRPHVTGAGRPRDARALPGCDQRRRRPHRGTAADRGRHGPLPRLPLTALPAQAEPVARSTSSEASTNPMIVRL
jgi:error-prone DNA polymerase